MEDKIYAVPSDWTRRAFIDDAKYQAMYEASIRDPEAFWREHGDRIDWFTPYSRVKNATFGPGAVSIRWFEDGTTNAAYNCVDRHLESRGDQVAIIWEGDDPSESKHITYSRAASRGVPVGQRAAQPRGQARRPGDHLPADDPGSGLRHARLRAARRRAFGGVRRLLARFARRPHQGLRIEDGHHRRRGPARRPQGAAQGQCRRRHRARRRGRPRRRRAPHRRRRRHAARPRRLLPRRPPPW